MLWEVVEHRAEESRAKAEQKLSSSASFPTGEEAVGTFKQTGRADTSG